MHLLEQERNLLLRVLSTISQDPEPACTGPQGQSSERAAVSFILCGQDPRMRHNVPLFLHPSCRIPCRSLSGHDEPPEDSHNQSEDPAKIWKDGFTLSPNSLSLNALPIYDSPAAGNRVFIKHCGSEG